jgi:hypothetical protein
MSRDPWIKECADAARDVAEELVNTDDEFPEYYLRYKSDPLFYRVLDGLVFQCEVCHYWTPTEEQEEDCGDEVCQSCLWDRNNDRSEDYDVRDDDA